MKKIRDSTYWLILKYYVNTQIICNKLKEKYLLYNNHKKKNYYRKSNIFAIHF